MYARPRFTIILVAALINAGCLMSVFTPEHGYPDDWPALTRLAPGCTELDGTYVNQGVAKAPDGTAVPITLASLIPQRRHIDDLPDPFSPPQDAAQADSVSLKMQSATSVFSPPYTRATISVAGKTDSYKVESVCKPEGLLYVLDSADVGSLLNIGLFVGGQTRVFFTRGSDRSLIAMIHDESGGLIVVIPYYSATYTWARFQPGGD